MPQVVPFLIKIGAAVTFGAAAGTAAAVIGATVLVAGTFAASRLLKPKINFNVDDSDRSRQQTVRSTIEPRKLVYGETMVSGPLTYAKVTGTNNEYLHQVIALAGHELTAIKEVYFDDKSIDLTGGNYNSSTRMVTGGFFGPKNNENGVSENIVYIDTRLGAATQSPFTALRNNSETSGEYLSTHRGDGVAAIYTRWLINEGSAEVWDEVGKVQNIKCVVQGKKVYDPRLDVNAGNDAGDNATASTYKTYNDGTLTTGSAQGNYNRGNQGENPALQLADFLMDSDFGLGIAASKIDWDAVVTAADICDQLVPVPTSAVQKRFFGSGVIFGADTYSSSIEKILSAMNGSLIYSQGKYIMTAGKYVSPSETLTENDLVGPVQIQTAVPRADRVNTIKGLFIDPSENYKMMEFGPVTVGADDFNSDENNSKVGAVARDNGEVLTEEIKLPFTDNRYVAQRLALMQVAQSYHQTIITVPVNMKGMRIAIGDRVNLTLTDFESIDSGNWSPKVFKCIGWSFAEDGDGVNLTLLEDDSLNYNDPEEEDYSSITAAGVISTSLPDVPSPSALTLTAGINSIELNWTNPSNIGAWEQIYIYRDTSNTTPTDSSTPIARLRASSYIDQRAAADSDGNAIEYYYWIQAVRYPQGSTPAGGSTNAAKSPMVAASTPASGKIAATKIGQGVMDEDSVGSAQVIDGNIGSDQIATTIESNNWDSSGGTAGWQINKSGAASFQTATITGTITANDGTIGGTTITSTSLYQYSGSGSQSHGDADTDFYLDSSGNFSLKDKFVWTGGSTNTLVIDGSGTFSGTLSSVDGTFTGALSGGTISIGSNNDIFKADSNGIYLGNATFASAPFRVTPAGALTATNATITGAVTATSLTIDDGATVAASSAFSRTPFVSFTSIGQTAFSPALSGSEVTWTQVSGTYSWNHKLVSDKAFKNGAFVSFRVKSAGDINTRYMIGLADVNTGTSFTQIDYAIYIRGSAVTPDILAYESGSNAATLKSTLNVGDVCTVLYDDEKIKYIINGVVERTVDLSSSPITAGLYAHIAIDDGANNATHTIEDFRFGSISDLALGVTIQDGGITMADGGSIKGGQTGYDTGTGFFLGYDSAYKFSIGNSGGNKLTFDGQDLTVTGAVNASSGTFSGDVSTDAKFIAGSNASTVTLDGTSGASHSIFAGADTSSNASFRVDSDGVVEATRLIVRDDANGQVLIDTSNTDNPFSGVVYTSVSAGSGASVETVAGTLDDETDEITIVTTGAETFTITTKVAIDDNDGSTNNISGASTTSTSDAENQLIGSDLKVEYYLKEGSAAYAVEDTQVIEFTAGTPTTSQIKVFGVDRGSSYSGSLTRYFAVIQSGGAGEIATYFSTSSNANRARTYAVSTGTISISAAGTHKIKIVARLVDANTDTTLTTSTTPKLVDGDASGTYGGSGIVLGNETIPDQSSLQDFRRLYEMTSSSGFVVDSADDTFSIGGGSTVLTTGGTISGNLVVTGDLTIQGTTTTIDTANLNVEDKNITLNYGTGDTSANADGAGITIQDAVDSSNDATILWDATNDEWDFSHPVKVAGSLGVTNIVTNKVVKYNGTILDDSNITDTGSAITLGTATTVSGQLESTRLFINVPDGGSSPALTAYMNIYGYEGRGAGIMIRDSANSASNPSDREWFIGSGYNQSGFNIGYAADGSQSSYADQNMFFLDTSGNATITGGITANGLEINHSTHTGVDFNFTDSNSNSSFYGMHIDHNVSGSDALDNDYTKAAIFVDMDNTSNAGTTSNELRMNGIYSDVRTTGDADLVRGYFGHAESNHSSGTIGNVAGGWFQGTADHSGSASTTNIYGVYGVGTSGSDGTGSTANVYGLYGKSVTQTVTYQDTTQLIGVYAEAEIADPGASNQTTIGSVFGINSQIDYNGAGNVTVNNGYLFYGNYAGTLPTTAWGVYIADDVRSRFGGTVETKDGSASTPSHSFYDDPDTGVYRVTTNQLGFSTGGTKRLTITSSGLFTEDLTYDNRGALNSATDTGQFILGARNGPADGTGTSQGPAIVWKPNYDTYTKESLKIAGVATNNFFDMDMVFYTSGTSNATGAITERFRLTQGGEAVFAGSITANGTGHTFYSSDSSNTLSFGRNVNEKLVTTVTDSNIELSAHQDSDSNGAHNFILDRHFSGSGANNFKIQKAGSDQFTIDTNAAATFAGSVTAPSLTVNGTISIATNAVPFTFNETGHTGTGQYWRMPIDGGNLRFDVDTTDTNGTGAFTSYKNVFQLFASGNANLNGAFTSASGSITSKSTGGGFFYAEESSTGLANDSLVGGFLFKNNDTSGTEPHYAGMTARTTNIYGSMALEFFADRADYESDTPAMILSADGADSATNTLNLTSSTAISNATAITIKQQINGNTIYYPLSIEAIDVGNTVNQLIGDGVGLQFKIAGNTNDGDSIIGAAIAAIRQNDADASSNTGLSFRVSQDDTTLDEALKLNNDLNATFAGTITANGTSASSLYALTLSRSGTGTTTPDIWGTNDTFVIGTSSSTEAVGFSGANATFYGDVSIPVASKLYFGGGSHTYISEDIDDRLRFFVGGAEFMRFSEDTTDSAGIYVPTTFTDSVEFNGPVVVDSDNNVNGALRVENVVSDTNNDFYFAFEISQTLNGTNAATADREQGGIYMDINSSNTGGDTSNEHRAYGIYIDLDSTGDADNVTGVYSNVTATPTEGTLSNMYAGFFYAEDNGGAGNVSNIYGVYGSTVADNADSDINSMYAGFFFADTSGDSGAVGSAHGVYAEIQIDGSEDIVGNSYVFRAELDNNTGVAQTNTTYLYYGNYAGTLPTTAYGVYIVDAVRNYFGGSITTAVGSTTTVSYGFNGDVNTGMYSPFNHQLGFACNGTERLLVNSTGILVTGAATSTSMTTSTATVDGDLFINNTAGTTTAGYLYSDSDDFVVRSFAQDKDIIFKGNDNGTVIEAMRLDMSAGGNANFNGTITLNGQTTKFAKPVYRSTSTIDSSGFTTVCTVAGDNLASAIRLCVTGTSNSVVINTIADILVNHSTDILINSQSGFYTRLTIKIVSNNNEDFAIELKHDGSTSTPINIEITPLGNEGVTFTSSHSFTGASIEHLSDYGNTTSKTGHSTAGSYTVQPSTSRGDLMEIESQTTGWGGISITNSNGEGDWAFMLNGANAGLYDDQYNQWHVYMTENGSSQLRYQSSEKIETKSYGLEVTGEVRATSNITAYSSDRRLKTNIKTIEGAIGKVKRLRGVEFDWSDYVYEVGFEPTMKHETGVIAQEVQEVIEDAVGPAPFNNKYLTVDKQKIIPVLIEAVKDQQELIETLMKRLEKLENGDN